MGFSPRRSLSATCFGIIWYNNSSVLRISSSNFRMLSSSFFDFCCSWSSASFSSTDCCVPANIKSLSTKKAKNYSVIETSFNWHSSKYFDIQQAYQIIAIDFVFGPLQGSGLALKQTTFSFIKISQIECKLN